MKDNISRLLLFLFTNILFSFFVCGTSLDPKVVTNFFENKNFKHLLDQAKNKDKITIDLHEFEFDLDSSSHNINIHNIDFVQISDSPIADIHVGVEYYFHKATINEGNTIRVIFEMKHNPENFGIFKHAHKPTSPKCYWREEHSVEEYSVKYFVTFMLKLSHSKIVS